eukprot:11977564-Heterocapsa_arctica.AAC.1
MEHDPVDRSLRHAVGQHSPGIDPDHCIQQAAVKARAQALDVDEQALLGGRLHVAGGNGGVDRHG